MPTSYRHQSCGIPPGPFPSPWLLDPTLVPLRHTQTAQTLLLSLSLSLSENKRIYIYIYMYMCIFHISVTCVHIYLSIDPSIHQSIDPSIYLSIYLSIHLSIFLSIYTYIHTYINTYIYRKSQLIQPSLHRDDPLSSATTLEL